MKNNAERCKSIKQNLICTKMEDNDNYGKLTLEELRKCEGFADVSDLEGQEIIESIYRLSLIAYNYRSLQ